MREIKTDEDVAALRTAGVRPGLIELVTRKLQDIRAAFALVDAIYDPDVDGPLILVESGDDLAGITGLSPVTKVAAMAEHVERHDDAEAWEAILVPSNSYALTLIIPDELPILDDLALEFARQADQRHIAINAAADQEASPF